jgi:large subunit ribosomal protein L21
MFAIVDISGQQMKVESGRFLYVNRLAAEEGAALTFDKVLLVENGGNVRVGQPFVGGASVKATVMRHLRDDKVIVFKKKRRKGYKVKRGHRQHLTQIRIEAITA